MVCTRSQRARERRRMIRKTTQCIERICSREGYLFEDASGELYKWHEIYGYAEMFEAFARTQAVKGVPNRMIQKPGMFIRDIKRSFMGASEAAQQAAIEDFHNFDQIRNAMMTTTRRSSQRRGSIHRWTTFGSIPEENAEAIQAAFLQSFG